MTGRRERAAAFIDRDGVINQDHGYVSRWEDFEFLPGVIEAMAALQSMDYALVVVTNQSGIGRGFYTEADFRTLTAAMTQHLRAQGVEVAGTYFCPHHPTDALGSYRVVCDCRKPAPGLLLQAARELPLSLKDSIMVGDKPSDIAAGHAAGVARCYHVTIGAPATGSVAVTSLTQVAGIEASLRAEP